MRPARLSSRRGHWVVLVGPDGVGKTTVARALIEHYPGPTAYFHFLPPLRGPLEPAPEPGSHPPPAKAAPGASRLVGWLRLFRNAIRCWAGYLNTVRPALAQNALVVADRWVYGYLVQPDALKFRGPHLLAKAVLRLLPQPDLVVNLAAPPHLIRTRKGELPLSQIEHELAAWSSLPLESLRTLDATRPPEVIAGEILEALEPLGAASDAHRASGAKLGGAV